MSVEVADRAQQQTWLSYAELAAIGALITANRRLLRQHGRALRNRDNNLRAVDPVHWHTILPTEGVDVDELLRGVLALFHRTAPTPGDMAVCIGNAILEYLGRIIQARIAHERHELARALVNAGCLSEEVATLQPRRIQ